VIESSRITTHVAAGRFVERRRHDFAAHGARHLGDFLGPLVDEQHDQVHLGVVAGDRVGDVLQQHRLARFRRRDDEAALALTERRDQVDHARGEVFGAAGAALQLEATRRVQRREVLEQDLAACVVRRIEVDLADLQQREVALAIFRRTDEARDGVAGAQVEAADLRRADVDVVGTRQVRAFRRAQEAEAVLQDLEHAVPVDAFAVAGVRLEDREDDVLLARAGQVFEAHRLGELEQLRNRLVLQRAQVHRLAAGFELGRADDVEIVAFHHEIVRRQFVLPRATISVWATTTTALVSSLAVAVLVAQVTSHRLLSRKAATSALRTAPIFWPCS
jgi:hypothetical protein